MPRIANPNVLVGFDTADDAGVYRLTPDLALVQTVDFFTPIVDDPFTFGAIAAANALSDVYAMGGTPISSLSMVAFPADGDTDVLEAILLGGLEKMREAGCAVLGGHSVADAEIKFGYAVTGTIHPGSRKANSGARPGDALVFTKAIGTGVIGTALKRGIAQPASVDAAIASMLTLNRAACEAMLEFDVHGCTDVTGFGFLGHAREMALGERRHAGNRTARDPAASRRARCRARRSRTRRAQKQSRVRIVRGRRRCRYRRRTARSPLRSANFRRPADFTFRSRCRRAAAPVSRRPPRGTSSCRATIKADSPQMTS